MVRDVYDICVVGGGINGCGIARDAAGRGYKVLLLEKGDLASGTSSKSTKLIHGGLRYLEQYDFSLVHKSLKEREILLRLAPHIIHPMKFILPHAPHLRPMWMIRLGLYLYDFLGGKKTVKKSFKTNINNKILKQNFRRGVAYYDCRVDDCRLVVLNAMDAQMRGATILRDTKCNAVTRADGAWNIQTDKGDYSAQMIVNASGPWAAQILGDIAASKPRPLRLVKGSHIIVPRLYGGDDAYLLQNADGRVVFIIPYQGDYTLIGTTDVDIGHDPDARIAIDDNEINYLMDVVNRHFVKTIKRTDIIETFAGVRPLIDEGGGQASKASRGYNLDLQMIDTLPFLSILGGKLTTYRVLSEEVVDMIDRVFDKKPAHWTGMATLPGGDVPDNDLTLLIDEMAAQYPFLSRTLLTRYVYAYGTCAYIILDGVQSMDDMGDDIGGGIYGRELDYLYAYEFAKTAEDVLWRRSKLGLHVDRDIIKSVEKYMDRLND